MILASVRTEPAFAFMVVALVIVFGPIVAQRLRLPGLVGLLVGGALIGPNTTGILGSAEPLEGIGEIGVLFLIFLAGLELDLKTFRRHRSTAATFGLITATLPWAGGTLAALAFGYEARAAILIGSFWASFTLVSYGVVTRYSLTRVPSVAATVGASAITDTIGLVALASIVGAETGSGGGLRLGLEIAAGLVGVAAYGLVLLPAVVRWFFAGVGLGRQVRFVMVLAAFTSAAVVADALGIEPLLGAFFAGVGLNRLIPNRSPLMERIDFLGNSLFIPVFIISVGLLVEPGVVADPRTLSMAAAFSVALLGGKAAAAWLTGRIYRFAPAEVLLMFSLSSAQAAATLASTVIGFEIGLYEADVVNAVMVVIIVSLVVSAVGSSHAAPRIDRPRDRDVRHGEIVLLPDTGDDRLGDVIDVAGHLAAADGGVVVPIVVATSDDAARLDQARRRVIDIEEQLTSLGLTGEPLLRVDGSMADGVGRAAVEHDATLVVVPWRPRSDVRDLLFGGIVDEIAGSTDSPTLLVSPAARGPERVLVAIARDDLAPAWSRDAELAVALATALRERTKLDLAVGPAGIHLLGDAGIEVSVDLAAVTARDDDDRAMWLETNARPGDIIVSTSRQTPLTPLPRAVLDECTVLVAAAHRAGRWRAPDSSLAWGARSADRTDPDTERTEPAGP